MDNIEKKHRPKIKVKNLVYLAWQNVASKKLRSSLTILGIVIGIGSIGFLVSFGLGLQRIVTQNVVGDKSIKSIEVSTTNSRIIKLDTGAVNKLRRLPHIEKLGVTYSFPASVGLKGGGIDAVIYGIDKPFQDMTNLELVQGRLLQEDDSKAALVSTAALRAIGINDPKKAINQTVDVVIPLQYVDSQAQEIRGGFKVVGVLDSGQSNEIFVPSAIFDAKKVPSYKQVKIITTDTDKIPQLRKQIESYGFQTTSPVDTLAEINQLFKFFNIILAGFGGIGIIVAILGMFNTLTISLLERTKEIGLMITLGGRKRDMRRLFIIEAVILSTMGAVVGIILALLGSRIVNFLINRNAQSRVGESFEVFYMPFWLVLSLTGFMVAIGLIVAYFPARRAQRINPIDALRRE